MGVTLQTLYCPHLHAQQPFQAMTQSSLLYWTVQVPSLFFFALNTEVQSSNTGSHSFYWADPEWTLQPYLLICFRLLFQKKSNKTSLVVQWFRICLPKRVTWIQPLVSENPTSRGATRWVHCNYWSQCSLPDLVSRGIIIPTETMKGRWQGEGENTSIVRMYLTSKNI